MEKTSSILMLVAVHLLWALFILDRLEELRGLATCPGSMPYITSLEQQV